MAKRKFAASEPEPEIEEVAGESLPGPPAGFTASQRETDAIDLLRECLAKFARSNARLPSRADWPGDAEELLGRVRTFVAE